MSVSVDKIRVLFVMNGLTHYFNKVLNKLNSIEDFKITVLVPSKDSSNLGTGVHTTNQDIEFKVHTLPEKKRFYGKVFFDGFSKIIEKENPQIIVIIWPYILEFVFNPFLLLSVRKKGIKIFYKDIPFQLVKFKDGLLLRQSHIWTENEGLRKTTLLNRINLFFVTITKWFIYRVADANLNYINDAYELLKSYSVPEEDIFVTYNSPDTDALLNAYKRAKQIGEILASKFNRIITVGRLVRWKRVDLLIEAVNLLRENCGDIELIIIGSGPEEIDLIKLAKELKLDDHVKFIGPVYDPALLGRYYLSSSVYVQPGMGGLAINEAMCFGKPVICSVCDGTEKELVQEGINGLYFSEGNKTDLADKIKSLLADPEMIKKMGKQSESIIKNEINIHTVIRRYENAFHSMLNNIHI